LWQGGGGVGIEAGRLHDINGAHFVHFICVICQPKCVAFSLLIYRARGWVELTEEAVWE